MENDNRREELRLEPPRQYVLEAALWLRPSPRSDRLTIADMGQPDLTVSGCADALTVQNLSSQGARLGLPCQPAGEDGPGTREVWLYLKLFAPWDQENGNRLSLFLRAEAARLEPRDGGCRLALRFLAKGVPERDAKALWFTDAERFGVSELYRWLQAYARHSLAPRPPQRGLDLDRLLEEIASLYPGRRSDRDDAGSPRS